jgi:hypothetical protein
MGMGTDIERSNDLASRVFNKPLFALPWVVFLMIVVVKFWWVRDAALVCWAYGREAYVHGGIRVLPGKPTRFSNGQIAQDLPDLMTGFAYFFTVVFGLSLLLIWCLRGYERLRRRHNEA